MGKGKRMKNFLKKEFGIRMEERRNALHLKQKHICLMMHIPIRTYQSWVYGEAMPNSTAKMRLLANILECDPGWLEHGPKQRGWKLSPDLQELLDAREKMNEPK
jgi:transcriptional regulator with XRE-family HTH domain